MTDLARTTRGIEARGVARSLRKVPLLPLLRKVWPQMDRRGCAGAGLLGVCAVAYADHSLVAISLVSSTSSLLASARFLRREVSYSLIAAVSVP